MPVLRKRLGQNQDKRVQINGLYVHSNPPKVLQIDSLHLKQLIKNGDIEKLEYVVLEGQGRKLVGEHNGDYKTRAFLKTVPALMSKISLLHDAVNSGRLEELQSLLDEEPEKKKRLVLAKDEAGVGLLHKAVYYDLKDIAKYLIENYPPTVHLRDAEGRTAYHYTPMCKDKGYIQKLLKYAGADPGVTDFRQHTPKYYMDHPSELELPSPHKTANSSRKGTATKDSLNIKKSNIRIWIHQRNLANLQQVVWEGHGSRLLVEHSTNPKVKKFLEAVPQIMNLVKDTHSDVVNNELESLESHMNEIPAIVLSGKDSNGLTPLHKAAGLGYQDIARYIVEHYPKSVQLTDNDGRTPLHFAAIVKDGGEMFDYLLSVGADESVLDNRQKTAAFYRSRSNEIDVKLLHVLPECPRMAKETFPPNWDWSLIGATVSTENTPKVEKKVNEIFENVTEAEPLKQQVEELKSEKPDEENHNEEKEENKETTDEQNNEENKEDNPHNDVLSNDSGIEKENEENENEANADENVKENGIETANVEEKSHANTQDAVNTETTEEVDSNPEETDQGQETKKDHPVDNETEIEQKHENDQEVTLHEDKNNFEEVEHNNALTSSPKNSPAKTISIHNTPINSNPNSPSKTEKKTEDQKNPDVIDGEGVIEGVVNGENEIESVNEEGTSGTDINATDSEITALIESGNMEQLAALVLNGQGAKLVDQKSDNAELQAFLENVPIYMGKINRIHLAARHGTLKELQAALDRRKFAIAKDEISPDGASPLHVATIFGNTSIVRYLAGRFPETVSVVDHNGRTPLHYAATVADNGHYYNLLVHLGADIRTNDNFEHTPEYYRTDQEEFSHRILLEKFGAEQSLLDEMLSDKDSPSKTAQVEMPFFCTEEGRYLASSLGDPLIKGLTEVANKRPDDPIAYLATYLYNFANNNRGRSRGSTQETQQIISGPPFEQENNDAVPATIDVVTLEPENNDGVEESAFNATSRDEHGQSMVHFAAARAHGRNALFQLLIETEINIGYRDELYRTARDISIQTNLTENTEQIDMYVIHIATKGDTDKLVELLLDGYDHIIDIADEENIPILEAVTQAGQPETCTFLQSILTFEERRERVHHCIREGSLTMVQEMLADENETGSGKLLAIGKNSYGRCTLHIAVLCQQEEIVDYLANTFPDTLKIGDNLERTALHYAMGVEKMESISRVLIKAGSIRVVKDLKGRQPTYYFMNKSDILRLQEEEEMF